MIFVTVGSQLPFDRLVHAVDAWASASNRKDVFAQVGASDAPPTSIEWAIGLEPADFDERVSNASVIVGHAGTGTIMAGLAAGKPVVVLARREALAETRNDHQVATATRFAARDGVFCAAEASEVGKLIEQALALPRERKPDGFAPYASGPLVDRLRGFLDQHLKTK